jgi:hypothetical protein
MIKPTPLSAEELRTIEASAKAQVSRGRAGAMWFTATEMLRVIVTLRDVKRGAAVVTSTAADEVKALTGQVAALKAENKEIDAMNTAYIAEVARVRAERDALKVERGGLRDGLTAIDIQIYQGRLDEARKLIAALSPLKQDGGDAEGA